MAEDMIQKVVSTLRANPALTGLITTAAVGVAWTVNDFLEWKSFGTGGTPPTWAGYWKITKLRVNALLRGDDLLDTSVLSRSGPGYLVNLPRRSGSRPKLMPRILPQRQVPEQMLSTASRTQLHALVTSIAASRPDLFEIKPSHTEGKTTEGLYARKDVETLNPIARDPVLDHEIAHSHPAEDSLHVWLSDRDAIDVIEKGWGQRFCLPFVKSGWTMVYAPRNLEEVQVVESIVKAGASFITGTEV
ncbi:uncharacterized protein JN550_012109 [Neoarthrinium moseri]|uniref:uncharacterized protein n=1 Tax=Neoarthrinium moseri TaxID=1658444 RepID=UPI001FDE12FC|nr:uncharacterized protein JN550_012109 [Neoarthrinium moseri]KAI1859300.1 hypothetical protein JN550_012109 [Neoarthrinium moseri]